MFKKIVIGYSLVYIIFVALFLGELLFSKDNYMASIVSGYGLSSVGEDTLARSFVLFNFVGFITVLLSSLSLHKNKDAIMPKIGIWLALLTVVLSIVGYAITNNNTVSETLLKSLAYAEIGVLGAYVYVIPLILTFGINAENSISDILKKANFFIIGVNLLSGIAVLIIPSTITKHTTYEQMISIAGMYYGALKAFAVSIIFEFLIISLAHILNYSLMGEEAKETEIEDDINFEELAKQAEEVAKNRQKAAMPPSQQNEINNTQSEPVAQPPVQTQSAIQPVHENLSIPVQSGPVVASGPIEQKIETPPVQPVQENLSIPVQQPVQNNLQVPIQAEPQVNVQTNNQ